jgi:glycosyltransferase involved in cell wall biosynthesis
MNDDVTVVIANHDYGAYLPEAVDSAVTQAGGAPQVVVVDDGSTDPATLEVLDALPEGVRVLRQANAGTSAARNAGLAASTTPYVLCLDADDRLAAGALEELRGALDEHPGAGFAYGHQRLFGAMETVMRFPPYDPLRLLDRHLIGPTAVMRRAMLDDVGGYDTAFALYEDWELWINALAHGWRGVRVDAITHEYRRHAGSKLGVDRGRYRAFRRQVRAKHASLYARRRELARESSLSAPGRAAYRWFWGPRPVPARVEAALYAAMFSSARKAR